MSKPMFSETRRQHMLKRASIAAGDHRFWDALYNEMRLRLSFIKRKFTNGLLIHDLPISAQKLPDGFQATLSSNAHEYFGNEQCYDAILVCGQLHMVDDVPAYLQLYKAHLQEDGLFMASFWGGESLGALRRALLNADQQHFGGAYMRVPPMINLPAAAGLMQQSGLALPVVDSETIHQSFHHILSLLKSLRQNGLGNAGALNTAPTLSRTYLDLMEESYREIDPSLTLTMDMVQVIGWAPSASQPKPAKRGSGSVHLATALSAAYESNECA